MGTDKPKKKSAEKPQKTIFVIMPFTCAHERDQEEMTAFFVDNIKEPVESNKKFKNKYSVRRSDDTFNITKQIILDLFTADIVICDLSGKNANPNVMYELGIRMALSNKPVILIREKHVDNSDIFDIGGFYVHPYNPKIPREVTNHICKKIEGFEGGNETYVSPLIDVLGEEVPLVKQLSRNRAIQLLRTLRDSIGWLMIMQEIEVAESLGIRDGTFESGSLVDHLKNKGKDYEGRDWTTISILSSPPAPLEHYVCTLYLSGLVDESLLERVSQFLSHYYGMYSQPTLRKAVNHKRWVIRSLEVTKNVWEVVTKLDDYLCASTQRAQTDIAKTIEKEIASSFLGDV